MAVSLSRVLGTRLEARLCAALPIPWSSPWRLATARASSSPRCWCLARWTNTLLERPSRNARPPATQQVGRERPRLTVAGRALGSRRSSVSRWDPWWPVWSSG